MTRKVLKRTLSEQRLATSAALFGALTAIFEFLTGGIPSGVIVLIAVIALDDWADSRIMSRRLFVAIGSFLGAVVCCFAIKMAVVAALWGPRELAVFGLTLGAHAAGAGWDIAPENAVRLQHFHINIDKIKSSRLLSYLYGLSKIIFFSKQLVFGSSVLALFGFVIAPMALVIRQGYKLLWCDDGIARMRNAFFLLACAVTPVWYFVMVEHTIVHAFFMYRLMVWPLALLLAAECRRWVPSRF